MEKTTETTATATREEILGALSRFISRRTGMEHANYFESWRDKEGVKAYRDEYRSILLAGKDARTILRMIELRPSITAVDLISAMDPRGRFTYNFDRKEWDYTVGQYWCTEYRPAAVRYLLRVLVNYFEGYDYAEKRAKLVRELRNALGGRRIQRNYLS